MDTRSELVRLAQAGEPAAMQSFIEQNHAPIYQMALSILNDPVAAARAARDSGAALIENLANYPGPSAHTAWIYQITLRVCRRQLRWQQAVRRLPHGLRTRLRLETLATWPTPGGLTGAARLNDNLRLPLVLRYMHDLLPEEIALVLGWRASSVQRRLCQARAELRRQRPEEGLNGLPAGPEEGLSHSQTEKLLEAAADFHITDEDAGLLKRHLKDCPRCQEAARRLTAFENELRAVFHQQWDGEAVPAVGAVAGALGQRRRQMARRHSLNLGGAVLLMAGMVALIVLLPALLPGRILPPPPAAPAPTPTAVSTATHTPTVVPSPTSAQRAFQRPFPTTEAATPRPISRRDLLSQVFPGKIAFTTFSDLTDHVFTFEPGKPQMQQLSSGISENSFPAWSPQGNQIAYLSMPQSWGLNQIFVVNSDGSDRFQVTPANFQGSVSAKPDPNDIIKYPLYGPPHWSADGQSVVSAVWVSTTRHFVSIFPVHGGKELSLPVEGLDRDFLDWSPNGDTIAYLAKNGRELWIWEPEQPLRAGQNPKKIYSEGTWDMVFGLAWAPDSYTIALLGGLREQDVVQVDLRIVRKYGLEVQNIPISTGMLTRTPLRNSGLAWSPDGRYMAFTAVFTNNDLVHGKVMLVRAETRAAMPQLAVMDREVTGLTWSPDGRWLAFSAGYEIWAASLKAYENGESPLVRLTRSAGSALTWQPPLQAVTQ